jgi:methyl-accepting chemotaxis protein
MTSNTLNNLRTRFIGVADATFAFQIDLRRRLREIDRKALNAQVLVKRHGKELIGYGVVAQSFREGAQQLQNASATVQQTIQPLMLGFMQTLRDTLRDTQQIDKLVGLPEDIRKQAPQIDSTIAEYQRALEQGATQTQHFAQRLNQALGRFESIVAEIEYVVINGRIEAALKGSAQATLAQVSSEMDKAVAQVRKILRTYRECVDGLL